MERRELVNTGMYTEKQAALNMERCAEFMARMLDSDIWYIITAVKAIQFGSSTKTQSKVLWLWRKRRCGKMRRE